jgi:asparagine N-glycosylation enzyme membrane subunit Stt3
MEQNIEKRTENFLGYLNKKKNWLIYIVLAVLVYIGVFVRTRNISKLEDIATGTWTLGPDVDPFLFLRWAEYIVENGSLMAMDMMRYVPHGYDTAVEMKLMSYLLAWFYQVLSIFSKDITVTYSSILFPVIMFALTTVAFFLFARKIFYKESSKIRNLIALVATGFFVVIPSLLPRTIAGIPEKESAAFFFLFLAFYFILEAFTAKKMKKGLIFGILAGVSTAMLALIWGGVIFVFFTIPVAFFLAFLFGKVTKNDLIIYTLWLVSSFVLMMPFSTRYTPINLVTSLSTGSAIGVLALVALSMVLIRVNSPKLDKVRRKTKIPKRIFSILVSIIILVVVVFITLGPTLVFKQISEIKSSLIQPQETRFGLTVAENKQPYFATHWRNSFGPIFVGIPLFFWMFIIGSVVLFGALIKSLSMKERIILIFGYFIFLISLIFSRYSPNHILDGLSKTSLLLYFFGWIFFLGLFGYFYYKRSSRGDDLVYRKFNFAYLLYFMILTLGIIGARGGVRLIMVLGAVSPVAIAFLVVKVSQRFFKEKDDLMKILLAIFAVLLILSCLFTFFTYYNGVRVSGEYFAPGLYQWQWQSAMSWVRENTASDAVFAHWWDYGYWVQSLGERATILDGGNAYVYWNHLMGRHVLTGTSNLEALEYLYAHGGTHLLIDSTEIGKYPAYSSIGSDEDYDRYSWLPRFILDESQVQETGSETTYIYVGGTFVDGDITLEEDGNVIFLPKGQAAIAELVVTSQGDNLAQPEAVYRYQNEQYRIPLRYAFFNGQLYDFGSGLEAGVFILPHLIPSSGGSRINEIGAAIYLSKRTVNSRVARLYLFGEEGNGFNLVHKEDSFVIKELKTSGAAIEDFVLYNEDLQGPIKIWEVNYPSNIEFKEEYLLLGFPDQILNKAKPGAY